MPAITPPAQAQDHKQKIGQLLSGDITRHCCLGCAAWLQNTALLRLCAPQNYLFAKIRLVSLHRCKGTPKRNARILCVVIWKPLLWSVLLIHNPTNSFRRTSLGCRQARMQVMFDENVSSRNVLVPTGFPWIDSYP